MRTYNFYEFDGFQLLEKIQKSGRELDFSSRTKLGSVRESLIKSSAAHKENAMFYQVKRCLEELKEYEDLQKKLCSWNDNSLKDVLIYIDFSRVFPVERYAAIKFDWKKKNTSRQEKEADIRKSTEMLENFFLSGFDIRYQEGAEPVHYVPFEKSASMARESTMLFMDERLYERTEERLHLGMNFAGVPVVPSKLYAYTGLYLSDAKRIPESERFRLNEETVVILPDDLYIRDKTDRKSASQKQRKPEGKKESGRKREMVYGGAITAHSRTDEKERPIGPDKDGFQHWDIKVEENYVPEGINYFDGEGIISPEYCRAVNEVLQRDYGAEGTAASIQIRLPFIKGMLHEVDFHRFLCERLGVRTCEDLWVIDAYGQRRNLAEAQIILTESMFKISKDLKKEKISGLKDPKKVPELYFSRFHEYDHALYVGNTDSSLSEAGRTKLNYQFLNTLALTEAELNRITEEQLVRIRKESGYTLPADSESAPQDTEAGEVSFEEDSASGENGATWSIVARKNPVFLSDKKIKGMMKGVRYSLLKDTGRGRLTVSGSVKFLSRDLVAFLSHMVGRIEIRTDVMAGTADMANGGLPTKEKIDSVRRQLGEERLYRTRFFAADSISKNPCFAGTDRKLRLRATEYCGLLRNPHLSRSEQCSLRPYIPRQDSIYARYFGHLKGIIMVSRDSFVPQALGGADFDGDLVKVITDERVNRAINDACYYPDDPEQGEIHSRRLPVVFIPAVNAAPKELKQGEIDFQTLKDTFSSRIGEISNYAIYLGKREYDRYHPDPEYDWKCETCTILTGLEIDAAKTGTHPYLGEILPEDPEDRKKDYFVEKKEKIDNLPEWYQFKIKEYPAEAGGKGEKKFHRLAAVKECRYGKGPELMSADDPADNRGLYPIDHLPYRFLQELAAEKSGGGRQTEPDLKDEKEEKKEGEIPEDSGAKPGKKAGKTTRSKRSQKEERFVFEKDEDWKRKLSDPDKTETVRDLIRSYTTICKVSGNVYRTAKSLRNTNYGGRIHTILAIQYEGLLDEKEISDLQERIYDELLVQLDSCESAEAALDRLVKGGEDGAGMCEKDERTEDGERDDGNERYREDGQNRRWQFCRNDEEKELCLNEILCGSGQTDGERSGKAGGRKAETADIDQEVKQALYNFRWNGSFLLYYYLRDIPIYYREAETEELQIAAEEEKAAEATAAKAKGKAGTKAPEGSRYYPLFRRIFQEALQEKETQEVWKKRIVAECRDVLRTKFENRADEALMYVAGLEKSAGDRNGNFRWDVFTADEILKSSVGYSDAG